MAEKRLKYFIEKPDKKMTIEVNLKHILPKYIRVFGENTMDYLRYDIHKCRKQDIINIICMHNNHMLNSLPKKIVETLIHNLIIVSRDAKTRNVAADINKFVKNITYEIYIPAHEPNAILDAIYEYVNNTDFVYDKGVEKDILEGKSNFPPGMTFKRSGFVALHMFSAMIRLIFPLYEEILSRISDTNLKYNAQMQIVDNISKLIHAKTRIDIMAKINAMVNFQMGKSEKRDRLIWDMANMMGSGSLHTGVVEIRFKRVFFTACLKLNFERDALHFIHVTIEKTILNKNHVNFPIKCHEVSNSSASVTSGIGDDDDDPFERLMNQFNGIMGIPDETTIFLQDILVRENIQRFLKRNCPDIDLKKIEDNMDYYIDTMHADMTNNSFVTAPQQHIVSMFCHTAFSGTANITSMSHSDYIYLAMGIKQILEYEGLEFLASIMSAKMVNQLARARDRLLTARLTKEIQMDDNKLGNMYRYVQKNIFPHSPEFFDEEDCARNPIFNMVKRILNVYYVYNEADGANKEKNGEKIECLSYSKILIEVMNVYIFANFINGTTKDTTIRYGY